MFGHYCVRFVIDALYLASIFNLANNAPKNDHSASAGMDLILWRGELRFRQ